jgi:non-canonical poly(A) RNA polymerase PAPD5/7
MQPPSARLVCRARNSFSPSTALWQHFVAPNQHLLYHGRHSSSVPATTQVAATNHTEHHASPEPTISGQPRVEPRRKQGSKFTIRKVNSVHSSFVRSKRTASIQKNIQDKVHASKESLAAIGQLLLDTGDSYEKHNDYEGVVVKPIVSEITVKPRYFPWCIPVEERPPAPTDRYVQPIPSPLGHSNLENADSIVRSRYFTSI